MNVGVADAAIGDIDDDVVRTRIPPVEGKGN
jgi:hypothetical protein